VKRLAHLGREAAAQESLSSGSNGSGCVNPLIKFVAGKRPLEIRFPEAASRQCVLPILNYPSPLMARCPVYSPKRSPHTVMCFRRWGASFTASVPRTSTF
jgi:hypothetical protein